MSEVPVRLPEPKPDKALKICPGILPAGWIRVVLDRFVICAKRKKSEREFLATNLFLFRVYGCRFVMASSLEGR